LHIKPTIPFIRFDREHQGVTEAATAAKSEWRTLDSLMKLEVPHPSAFSAEG